MYACMTYMPVQKMYFESLQMLRILLIQKQQAIFNTPNRGTEEAAIQIALQGGRRLQLPRKKYSIRT